MALGDSTAVIAVMALRLGGAVGHLEGGAVGEHLG
jgi:hypothetical protein